MTTSNWKAYNPRTIQNDGHWYALCTIEAPNGNTFTFYQAGTSELQASVLMGQTVTFLYGVPITQCRVG